MEEPVETPVQSWMNLADAELRRRKKLARCERNARELSADAELVAWMRAAAEIEQREEPTCG